MIIIARDGRLRLMRLRGPVDPIEGIWTQVARGAEVREI
jgi:hypothetical protein